MCVKFTSLTARDFRAILFYSVHFWSRFNGPILNGPLNEREKGVFRGAGNSGIARVYVTIKT